MEDLNITNKLTKNFEFMNNQIKSNQIKSNQIKSNQIKSNQIKSNQIKSNQIKSNQIKSNQIKSNQIKSNQIKSNQIKSNQIKSNQIKSKTFLLASLCAVAVLWGCKGDDPVDPNNKPIDDAKVVADFTLSKGTAGAVTFKNTSKNATSYAWDFGDGSKATDENPTHTYAKNDTYTVKLTATNKDGSADKTATVTIEDAISIDIADLTQLVLPKNSPSGVVIWKLAATVANTDETPVYSITSQNPAGVLGLKGNKMMLADASAVDYDTNTELKGEIQVTAGSATATATFTISITDGAGIYIPDANFKAVLVKNTALNTDGDQEISVAEAQTYTGVIEGINQGITDATSIEYFTKVTKLDLSKNVLTEIDISQNIALIILNVGVSNLTTLDVAQNTALTLLNVKVNNLIALDVSQNTALTSLDASSNNLTALDVSQNTALTVLDASDNNLTALDVSQNTALSSRLNLTNNKLTDIDVSKNTKLLNLWLSGNALSKIDISQNAVLSSLFLVENQLTDIDVSQNKKLTQLLLNENDLKKVNLANGNNNAITNLNLLENPDLTCVQVDDPKNIPSSWEGKYDKDKVTFQTDACP